MSECFKEAVKCPNFSSQKISKVHKFSQDGKLVGTLSFCFHIEKVSEGESSVDVGPEKNKSAQFLKRDEDRIEDHQKRVDDMERIEEKLKPLIEANERNLCISDLLEACDIDDVVSEITRNPTEIKVTFGIF